MKKIIINSGLSTELNTDFEKVTFLEIENIPFANGGFGAVYKCLSINGQIPKVDQVIKLFVSKKQGVAEQNYKTTQLLQEKVKQEHIKHLNTGSQSLLDSYPVFKGVAQFSFKGTMNGDTVIGFSSNDLTSLGFVEFKKILEEEKRLEKYGYIPSIKKMELCHQLVSGFNILESFGFVHADFKSEAIFVNLNTTEIAIIDYDSGAIHEKPLTWGAPNDWVAPEIREAQAKNGDIGIPVDKYCDRWSVCIGIHYLLTGYHPLFYLSELSERVSKMYFSGYNQWPNIDKQLPFFEKINEASYDAYLSQVYPNISEKVKQVLSKTINYGYQRSTRRATYKTWIKALSPIQTPPQIRSFRVDRTKVMDRNPILIDWEVEDGTQVFLNQKNVSNQNTYSLEVKQDLELVLTAINILGSVSEKIQIEVSKELPEIHTFHSDLLNNKILTMGEVTLSWDVSNFEFIEIVGIGDVSKDQSIRIPAPKKDTIFTLKATSYFGKVSTQELHLTIDQSPPEILSFLTSQSMVSNKDDPAILTWDIIGADQIEISNGVGIVTGKINVEVFPRQDTTYTISATSYFGVVVEKDIHILVSKDAPIIHKFESSKQQVTTIEDVILSWEVENAVQVFINQNIGDVSKQNSCSYEITSDTTFIITTISYFGIKSKKKITVKTSKDAPIISLFKSRFSILREGQNTTFQWSVDNAAKVVIDQGIGTVEDKGALVIVPRMNTYTLTAYSPFGYESSAKINLKILKKPKLKVGLVKLKKPPSFLKSTAKLKTIPKLKN